MLNPNYKNLLKLLGGPIISHGIRAWLTMCLGMDLNSRPLGETGPDTTSVTIRPRVLFSY